MKNSLIFLLPLFWIGFFQNSYSQITISSPTINFSQACASQTFNTYNFSFSFSPIQNLGAGNQFIVELSNASGNFANPVIVQTLSNTTSPGTGSFSLPQDTYGEAYRIRIRSTNPERTSNPSIPFSAYYAIHNIPFSINGNNGNVNLCGNDSYILSIDDLGTSASPVFYPSLTYKWYKNFTPIPGETESSLEVSEPGSYYVIVDYGSCTMNSYSNIVQVQAVPDIAPEISPQNNSLIICPDSFTALESSLQDSNYTYVWYKNNNPIVNSNNPTYQTSEAGVYHLEITAFGCIFESNALVLEVIDFDLELSETSEITLIPGQSISLSAITDANSPQFQWYRNDLPIDNAAQNTLTVTQNGIYKVVTVQTTPCAITKEATVSVIYPTNIEITISTLPSYESCMSTATELVISNFEAVTPSGIISIPDNSNNDYSYQWLFNNTPVPDAASVSLMIESALMNGNYSLQVTIPDFGIITSNTILINLAPENPIISNETVLCEGSTVLLSSTVSHPAFDYQWLKNGIPIANANEDELLISEAGNYALTITGGTCSATSNVLIIEVAAITLTSSSPDFDVILPGENKILTVATDAIEPEFVWYRNNVLLGQTQNSITANLPGEYIVVATQNQGCTATAEKTFTLEAPSDFAAVIEMNSDFNQCTSESIILRLASLTATTTLGMFAINDFPAQSYAFQWLRNGIAVPGATATSIIISDESQNGDYHLQISIVGFSPIVSNGINVDLIFNEPLLLSVSGSLCDNNAALLANISNALYSYAWHQNGIEISRTNSAVFPISEAGTYYLVINTGSCIFSSNSLTVTASDFSLVAANAQDDIIVPGESRTLSVITNAADPSFAWFRNNVPISDSNNASIAIDLDGEYKAIVTQNQGCVQTREVIFNLVYAADFSLTIDLNSNFQECISTEATLAMTEFSVAILNGTADLIGNPYHYTFQWYKDDAVLPGSDMPALELNGSDDNGTYSLKIKVSEDLEITSNTISVILGFIENVNISTGDIYCSEGTPIMIFSDVNDSEYAYEWFKEGSNTVIGIDNSITVTETGSYFLIVSFQSCVITSNPITILPFDIENLQVDAEPFIVLQEGTSVTINASGAQEYNWFWNDTLVSQTASIEITAAGIYTLRATSGGCETSRQFTVTLTANNIITIPNVVTPNSDGINDIWSLPMKYVNNPNVEIVIYAPDGSTVLRTRNYQNNWPESNFNYSLKNPVFYYTIKEDEKITKKGSITIVR